MNQRFVEAFYWVATLKSMTRAAEKLFMTQSAISSRVSALEEELGVLLIDRRDRQQFALTNAGMRFLNYAERLMTLHRQMRTGKPPSKRPSPRALSSIFDRDATPR